MWLRNARMGNARMGNVRVGNVRVGNVRDMYTLFWLYQVGNFLKQQLIYWKKTNRQGLI